MQIPRDHKDEKSMHYHSTPQAKLLTIDREYKVPVEDLFRAFTTSAAIKEWWWPQGLYTDRVQWDFRQYGEYFINMKGYEKGGGGMAGQFEEIVPNTLIVMTDNFTDENGKVITPKEAGMDGEWPEKIFITFEFEKVDLNQSSLLKLSQEGIPNEFQAQCIQGWSQSFDKLDKYLRGQNTN